MKPGHILQSKYDEKLHEPGHIKQSEHEEKLHEARTHQTIYV